MQLLLGSPAAAPSGIVTSGLVLHLDAGNAASYPGSGTTWTDLSGAGNNGTLINGPTYSAADGGQIVFDGVDDYSRSNFSTSFSQNTATFMAWVKRTGSVPNAGIIFGRGGSGSTGANGVNIHEDVNTIGYHWNNTGWNWNSGILIPLNTWCLVTLTITPSVVTAYLNAGTQSASQSVSYGITTQPFFDVGADGNYGGRVFKGSIAIARIYNRALSAAEITQNFDAQKARFGL